MAKVQISSWMATVKANVTNYSAPVGLSITSSTNDATGAARPKSLVQDGCGSCTLLVGASILVLGLAFAVYLHKEKRDPIQTTFPEKSNTLDGTHTPLQPPAALKRLSSFQYQRENDGQIIRRPLDLSNLDSNSNTIQYLCLSELTFSHSNQPQAASSLQSGPSRDNLPALIRTASHDPSRRHQAELPDPAEDGSTCIVCMERPSDAVLLECGHSGLCVECATALWDQARRCPLCRQSFAAVMRIVAREASSVRVEPVHYLLSEPAPGP
eukprot:CAMPEP_0172175416 /NCGR_PEP_ID=MMETSP1050-20130122/14214_1 /TAXON_ID=233186 /ORGANISM="Cryptomonas curvata, Strain CCAP979/52" /LENGTH=268 /DNA_ID=CAMNT_0012847513 /DNA_START=18 /DNA_END=821 /DNA_ORIENTATION=+